VAKQQAASVSYRPNPQAIKRNPNHANKIPPSARPLSRDPVPPPTITPEDLATRPYAVRRTAFAQLPIYHNWKSGGTNIIVMIKKINGNKQALAQELTEKLGIAKERIKLNPTTGHLELKVRCITKEEPSESGHSLTNNHRGITTTKLGITSWNEDFDETSDSIGLKRPAKLLRSGEEALYHSM
jgi:large subunit ribosomal protein L49